MVVGIRQEQDGDHAAQTHDEGKEDRPAIRVVQDGGEPQLTHADEQQAAQPRARGHSGAGAHHLEPVGAADRRVAIVLAVDDGERGHLAAEADTEQYGKEVEHPGIISEQQDDHWKDLQGKAHRHDPLAAEQVSGDRHSEPGYSAHQAHGRGRAGSDGRCREQGRVLNPLVAAGGAQSLHDHDGQEHDHNAVTGATPVVDPDEVPERGCLANLLEEHPRSFLGAGSGGGRTPGSFRCIGSQLAHSSVFRGIVENAGKQQEDDAAQDTGDPERHPHADGIGFQEGEQAGPMLPGADGEEHHQAQHDGRRDDRAEPLG